MSLVFFRHRGPAARPPRRVPRWLTAGALAVWLLQLVGPGCAGYKLGSTLPPDIRTIFIPTFVNQCKEPLIEIEATNATITEFQQDGTLKVVRALQDADVMLTVELDSITLSPLRYSQTDKSKPNEYRLTLSATFELKRARTQELIGQDSVYGEATFLYAGNMSSAKRSAAPKASEDMAKRLVAKVVEIWP